MSGTRAELMMTLKMSQKVLLPAFVSTIDW